MIQFEVKTVGLSDFEVRFRAIRDFREEVRDAMESAARHAVATAKEGAPRRRGAEGGKLVQAIESGPLVYKPGGAGGGGTYVINIGVNEEIAPYADWVMSGTGIYGPGKFIYAKKSGTKRRKDGKIDRRGRVMVFNKGGEGDIFRRRVKGQEPNDAWWEAAKGVANEIIRNRIRAT